MDYDFSSVAGTENLPEDLSSVTHVDPKDEEDEEDPNAFLREQQIDELINELSDNEEEASNHDDDDDDDGSSDDESSSSDEEESVANSSNRSQTYGDHSSIKESYEHSVQPNEPNQYSSLIHPSPEIYIDAEVSHQFDENQSNIPDVNHMNLSDVEQSNSISGVSFSGRTDHGNAGNQSNNESASEFNFANIGQDSQLDNHDKANNSAVSRYSSNYSTKSISRNAEESPKNAIEAHNNSELYQEYKKLQIMYNARGKELERLQKEERIRRENYSQEIKSLNLRLVHTEDEKDKLVSSLQECQRLISDYTHEISVLKGKLAAVELQFSAEKQARENAQAKLDSAEITIQSLEKQINSLTRSENAVRLQQQTDSIVKDLKLRHQKESLLLKEENDKLQKNLNDKISELETVSLKLSQCERRYEELQVQKSEQFNKLSESLRTVQTEYQKLLESGNIPQVAMMKIQIQHLEEEKAKFETKNSHLKDEVKSLEEQIRSYEAIRNLELESESQSHTVNKDQSSHSKSDLKAELKRSLKNLQSLRTQNNSLKKSLDDVKQKLPLVEEKAKFFESRYKESETKLVELQKKLDDVLPGESVPLSQHRRKINILEKEITKLQKNIQDISEKLETSSSNEKRFHEENKHLKNRINEMLKTHANDKVKAVEQCREKYLEIHGTAIKKLKEELMSNADKELKTVCRNYENKITELEREIRLLNDSLYDAKKQYVNVFEENKILLAKIDRISKPAEREEIEKELRYEYEKKLDEIKEKFQKDWTKQKMFEIQEFVNHTKQTLEEKFEKCLEEEQHKYQVKLKAETEKISHECQEKVTRMEQQYEVEKNSLHSKLKQDFQLKFEDAMKELHLNYQSEIKSIKEKFEKQILAMEKEMTMLKDKHSSNSDLKTDKEKILLECQDQINVLNQKYEAEKNNCIAKMRDSFQMKWKNEVKDLKQSHQNEIKCIKQNFEDKILALEDEIKTLKENLSNKSEIQDIQKLKEEYSKEKQTWEEEKLDLIKNEHVLSNKLSTALDIEKRLMEKILKYKKYVSSLKIKYQEKNDMLQKQYEKLKRTLSDKENQLQRINDKYNSNIHKIQEKEQKQTSKNSESQTDEPVVPKKTLIQVQDMFIHCLKKIAEDIKVFLLESRKRSAEQLKKALHFYHDRLISRIFQDVLKDAYSISPDLYIPRISSHQSAGSSSDNLASPSTVPMQFNSEQKFSNSTPIDRLEQICNTKPSHSDGAGDSKISQNVRSIPESGLRFEDVSFDFIPIKMNDPSYTSVKLPDYSVPGGLFSRQNILNSYSVRDPALSHIK